MNLIEYREKTKRTLPNLGEELNKFDELVLKLLPGIDLVFKTKNWPEFKEEISKKLNLSHMALGLASEVGELVNCIGTELKNEDKVDKVNLIEEIGDLYWYIANYANLRNLPIPTDLKLSIENEFSLDLLIVAAGDLVDIVKRFMAYNKPIDVSKELQTLYDIFCALQMMENVYQLDGNEIRAKNIAKLQARYPEKFSEDKANNRDVDAERQALN